MALVKDAILKYRVEGIAAAEAEAARLQANVQRTAPATAGVANEMGKVRAETSRAADQAERFSRGVRGGAAGGGGGIQGAGSLARIGAVGVGAAALLSDGDSVASKALQGAAIGGGAGAALGPWGMVAGALVGAIKEGLAQSARETQAAAAAMKDAAGAHRDAARSLSDAGYYSYSASSSVDYLGR
mgnify:CR=1 FL=1